MVDPSQLPYLLRLVEDESPLIRDSILSKLSEFGSSLEKHLSQLPEPPEEQRKLRLLRMIEAYRERLREFKNEEARVGSVIGKPLFQPGQLVRHRRYGYRGVVVEADTTCQADPGWYEANRTQPDRSQPWYHVLVHESQAVTYAAQTSLLRDDSHDEVHHPYVSFFFDHFEGGMYARNDVSWPQQ